MSQLQSNSNVIFSILERTKMPPSKSVVWKYFKRAADDKTVKCSLCSAELTYNGSTTSMHNHLRLKHPDSTLSTPTKQQPSMTSFNSPKKLSQNQKETITQAISDMIVSDYLPLSIVEGECFRNLMKVVAPDYDIPCRKTIRARITKRYEEQKTVLTDELQTIDSVAITTDTWTSNATDSYITVTEHHITDDWEMKSNVLMTRAMPERHTGVNIANRLRDCITEFHLPNKVESCVHDNARNMDCAGELCTEWSDNACFAHTLQLCIRPSLDLPLADKTISKCRKLVGHFKHSTTLTAEMRKRQELFELPTHELIQDVCTRWNSTQQMLERLCEQLRVISDIMLDCKLTKKTDTFLLPSDTEWATISDLSNVLKDLTDVTTFMSGQSDVSSSYVYPIVCGLIKTSLCVNPEDSTVVKKTKQCISEELIRRFQPFDIETASALPALASLLDPRYKKLTFFSREQRKATENALESRIDDIPLNVLQRDITGPPPSKSTKSETLHFLQFDSSCPDNEQDELTDYLKEKPKNVTPLK